VVLAIIALQVRFWVGKSGTISSPAAQATAGALILGFAVTCMHYMAMASTFCFSAPDAARSGAGLNPGMFATVVTIIAALVLLMAIAAVIFDRRVRLEIAMRQEAMAKERRATEQLLHARKLEAVGQLTGGIAHDFNNILSIIMIKLEAVDDELPVDSSLRKKIVSAQDAAKRGADLVARLMTFARRRQHTLAETDVGASLNSLSSLLQAAVPRTVELLMSVPESLHTCVIDRSELDTALLNLVVNARDAMPSGGQIHISACNRALKAGDPVLPAGLQPGDWVEIAVRDTGMGMPPEIQARIFEPFFTTKGDGKGTGLGLAMVHGFIYQSGGFLTLDSALGKGTTFSLFLPATDRARKGQDSLPQPVTAATILTVQAA
jgi:signal transduction histidine kinase